MKNNFLKVLQNKAIATMLLVAFFAAAGIAQDLSKATIEKALNEAYTKFKDVKIGKNADYIKELARVDSNIFGITIVTADGQVYSAGDISSKVSIQSISKAFVMAQIIEEQGHQAIQDKIGVDATGLKFNSIVAVEEHRGKEINPLVNPGAIAATSLVAGVDSAAKWKSILAKQSEFAGRKLGLDMPVYISEAGDNLRNQAIAHLLLAYGRMYFDPAQSTDVYTKQCAIAVNAKDLATMAATLANGGVNPVTKKTVVSPQTVMYTLPVMATAGLYDDSGIWFYNAGVPAKSGVGGGIVAVVPGKFGIAAVAPPLDEAGNSVKAQMAIKYIIEKLGVNPYLITPKK
ncbi:MAG TPA: glutaminase A [Saprospiraceae bacterium]|nr:glutaminase A [Saprospiraceae bacterium]